MIEVNEILQTMQMIHEQHFDIRTITMGISLLDCKRGVDAETAECVYEKVTKLAGNLVKVGSELESELGVPIVNKRISVTPVGMICGDDPMAIAIALDRAAKQVGVNFIGASARLCTRAPPARRNACWKPCPRCFKRRSDFAAALTWARPAAASTWTPFASWAM